MKCHLDTIEENLDEILNLFLKYGKDHPKTYGETEDLILNISYILGIEPPNAVLHFRTYNCFFEYLRQAYIPDKKSINKKVPLWYKYFKHDIPFAGKEYFVPDCFKKSPFYYPLKTGISPKKLFESLNYKKLTDFQPSSKEIHQILVRARSFDEEKLLFILLSIRGNYKLLSLLKDVDLLTLKPEFVKWLNDDIKKAKEFLGENWIDKLDFISYLEPADYQGNPKGKTMAEKLKKKLKEREEQILRGFDPRLNQKNEYLQKLYNRKFNVPYPDSDYVKVIRSGKELKEWAVRQDNCIFENHQLLTEEAGGNTFFVKILRSNFGATAHLELGRLKIIEVRGYSNRSVENSDLEELKKWISSIESGEISKIKETAKN